MKNLLIFLVAAMVAVILYFSSQKAKPNESIVFEIQKKSDSVAVASVQQLDSVKLRKLEALKIRIATAKYNDSIQRAKNQRR